MWATLKVDGTLEFHEGIPSLEQMQAVVAVGAEPGHDLVEVVTVGEDGTTMWINEEGKYCGVEPNPKATMIAEGWIFAGDVIMGDVLFTGGPDDEGETTSLSEAWAAKLRDIDARFKVITIGPDGVAIV